MKVIGVGIAIAMLVAVGVVAAFTLSDEKPAGLSPPASQSLATSLPTKNAPLSPTSTPGTATVVATHTPPMFASGSSDRMMGRAIAEPESTGGTLVIGVGAAPSSMNPFLASDQPVDSVLRTIFEPLIEPHPDTLEPVGVLAESWSVDARGTTWTFKLRAGVSWHDGEQFTAVDVAYSFERYLDPEIGHSVSETLGPLVANIQTDGDLTVSVTTSEVYADLPVVLGGLPIVAAHVYADVPTAELVETVTGTGPFQFVSQTSDGTVTVEAYDEYWDGKPALDSIVARPVDGQAEMIELLRAAELDVGTLSPGAAVAFGDLPVRVVDYPLNGFTMLGFNLHADTAPLFQDVRVRRALLQALDRVSMVEDVRAGYGDVVPGTLTHSSWAARPEQLSVSYPYDPARARELLDEAGWTTGLAGVRTRDGQDLSFRLVTNRENPIRIAYLEQIREQWSAVGVEVELVIEPFSAVEERLTQTGDYDAFLLGYSWGTSPDQSELWSCADTWPAANYTGYCNQAVDRLLTQANRELDPERRVELYQRAQELILTDLPVAILDFPRGLSGVVSRAHNVYPNAINFYFNVETWWLD